MTIAKITYLNSPDIEDENFLVYFFGEKKSVRLVAFMHELRKEIEKTLDNKKIKEIEKKMKELTDFQSI